MRQSWEDSSAEVTAPSSHTEPNTSHVGGHGTQGEYKGEVASPSRMDSVPFVPS